MSNERPSPERLEECPTCPLTICEVRAQALKKEQDFVNYLRAVEKELAAKDAEIDALRRERDIAQDVLAMGYAELPGGVLTLGLCREEADCVAYSDEDAEAYEEDNICWRLDWQIDSPEEWNAFVYGLVEDMTTEQEAGRE